MVLAAIGRVDVGDAARAPRAIERHLAGHRVRDQVEPSGLERWRDQHIRRREIRVRLATAIALPAVVTRRTFIEWAREDRQTRRNAGDVQSARRLLHQQLVAAGLGRRQKQTVWRVGDVFLAAEHPHQLLEFLVVGADVLVADRPVVPEAVVRFRLEVARPKAERDPAPMVGPPADHARAPPAETVAVSDGVWLTRELPSADAAVEFTEGLGRSRGAAARRVAGPRAHRAA